MLNPCSRNPRASCFSFWFHMSSRRWTFPKSSASTKSRTPNAHCKLQDFKKTLIFQQVYLHKTSTNPHGPCGIQELCMTVPTGEEIKNWAAQLSQPGESPKAKPAPSQPVEQPGLLSLSVFPQLSHILCFHCDTCKYFPHWGFFFYKLANCWAVAFPYQMDINLRRNMIMKASWTRNRTSSCKD